MPREDHGELSAKAAVSLGDTFPPLMPGFPRPADQSLVRSPPVREEVRPTWQGQHVAGAEGCPSNVDALGQPKHPIVDKGRPIPWSHLPEKRGESTSMEHVHPIPCRMTVQKVQQRVRDCSLSRVTTDEEDKASHTQHEGWGPHRASVPFEWCQTYLPLARQVL